MSRHHGRHRRLSLLAVTLIALVFVSPAGAAPSARSASARAADAKSWCAAVIATNTKLGTMKNKTFISTDKLSPTQWKNVVDAAVAGRSRFIALAPASIKTAVTHEMAYFVHLKANHYAQSTPLAPYTLAEVKKITNFEKTQCGIKFG